MTVPYDGARMISDPPFVNGRLKGTIPANPPLDANSANKVSWLLTGMGLSGTDSTPGDWFPGVTSMDYEPTLFDNSSGGVTATIDRSTGTSYPDGSAWTMPAGAKGISESGTNSVDDDAHCILVDWTTRRVLTMRRFYGVNGSAAPCYSGSAAPMDGEAGGWMVAPANWALSGAGAPGSGNNGQPGTGSGISALDGLVIPEEFEYFIATGQVLGGLRCTLPTTRISTGPIFPAWKTDGQESPSAETMKEGQMFYLAATPTQLANITDSGGSKTSRMALWGRFIATKMTRGIRLEDRTTGGFSIFAVNKNSWTLVGQPNKWETVFATTGITTPGQALRQVRNFPTDIRVLSETFVPSRPGSTGAFPDADFTFTPNPLVAPATATLTDASYIPPGMTFVARGWDLNGDGVYDESTSASTLKAFTAAGTYPIGLRVTAQSGSDFNTDTVIKNLVVSASTPANTPPTASFSVAPASPVEGAIVTLTSTAADPDGTIVSIVWDLDNDGAFDDATGTVATKVFATAGTYTVRQQVTDDDGATAIATRQIIVQATPVAAAPHDPTALTAVMENDGRLLVTLDLPRDDSRTSSLIVVRTADHATDLPGSSPSGQTILSDSAAGAASGNPGASGALFAMRPGADEIKLVRVDVPESGFYPLWAYVGGGGSGGSGSTKLRSIGFGIGAGGGPDGAGRRFLGPEVTIPFAQAMGWVLIDTPLIKAPGWVGLVIGGTSNAGRIARTLVAGNFPDGYGGDLYVDATVTYASPPTTCPVTGVGTSRASIYVATLPGGGRLGGRLQARITPGADDLFISAYTLNASGNGILDATPYPFDIGTIDPVSDVHLRGVGRLSFVGQVVRPTAVEQTVVLIPTPTGRPELKPIAWEIRNGVPFRRVEWDRETDSWIYV